MAGRRKKETDRQRRMIAVSAAFFCIGIGILLQSITVSAQIPWGEKVLRRYADVGVRRVYAYTCGRDSRHFGAAYAYDGRRDKILS